MENLINTIPFESKNTWKDVFSAFSAVFAFLRNLYYVLYNGVAKIAGNPTKTVG